jgi:hypothetical protein
MTTTSNQSLVASFSDPIAGVPARAEQDMNTSVRGAGYDMDVQTGLVSMQQWLANLYSNRLANYDDQGVVHIAPEVAHRFALGQVDRTVFLSIQRTEIPWAARMPWDYAAIYRGKKDLYLVISSIDIDGGETPPFGLSFALASVADAEMLSAFGSIELRRCIGKVESGFHTQVIDRNAFAELPILILDEGEPIFQAGTKRTAKIVARGGAHR